MITVQVSDKGQITLPADLRRQLGLKGKSRVQVQVRDGEIVLVPVRSVREVRGIFHEAAMRHPADWETARSKAEKAIAEQVAAEGLD